MGSKCSSCRKKDGDEPVAMEEVPERNVAEPVVQTPRPKQYSIYRRLKIQSSVIFNHWETYSFPIICIGVFFFFAIVLAGIPLLMHSYDGHSRNSRILHVASSLCAFGAFASYWQVLPTGPPFLAAKDGAPIPASYLIKYK